MAYITLDTLYTVFFLYNYALYSLVVSQISVIVPSLAKYLSLLVSVCWSMQAELKDSENEQLSQCLEALKTELSTVSNELGRFSSRSSQLERL